MNTANLIILGALAAVTIAVLVEAFTCPVQYLSTTRGKYAWLAMWALAITSCLLSVIDRETEPPNWVLDLKGICVNHLDGSVTCKPNDHVPATEPGGLK